MLAEAVRLEAVVQHLRTSHRPETEQVEASAEGRRAGLVVADAEYLAGTGRHRSSLKAG